MCRYTEDGDDLEDYSSFDLADCPTHVDDVEREGWLLDLSERWGGLYKLHSVVTRSA